jgi:hypothetical protein
MGHRARKCAYLPLLGGPQNKSTSQTRARRSRIPHTYTHTHGLLIPLLLWLLIPLLLWLLVILDVHLSLKGCPDKNTHTHTHTHTHSLSLSLSLSLTCSITSHKRVTYYTPFVVTYSTPFVVVGNTGCSLIFEGMSRQKHTHTYTHTHTLSLSLSFTLSYVHTHTHTMSSHSA